MLKRLAAPARNMFGDALPRILIKVGDNVVDQCKSGGDERFGEPNILPRRGEHIV